MMVSSRSFESQYTNRRGSVLPLLAVTLVALISFVALAIDVGMLAIAKAQVQNAADLAALTAARTLNGDATSNYNQSQATTNAQNILTYDYVLGQAIQTSQLQLSYGSYDYNQTTQTFNANFPATSGVPLTAVSSTVTSTNSASAFANIFGYQFFPAVTAVATAVHRPRDIALVMDLSGSMRMGTCLGFDFYTSSRTTNNGDNVYPQFGHYSGNSSSLNYGGSGRTSTSGNYTIAPTNSTAGTSSYTLTYINGFYQNAMNATTLIRAFDSYTSTDGGNTWSAPAAGATPQLPSSTYMTTPGGDVPLYKHGSGIAYATDVSDVVNGSSRNQWWELDGYSGCTNGSFNNADLGTSNYASGSFNAYTQGPGYYGKTFFLWPPDPRRPLTTTNDSALIYQFLQDFGYGSSTDFANAAFQTTLSANITSTATSLTVASSTPFPVSALPGTTFLIVIDSENMLVTAASGGNKTWTVTRAQNGTKAATHSKNATVSLLTKSPLYGIYGVQTYVSGSQTWPWPNDGGTTLSNYLTSNVYIPVSVSSTARLLKTTDAVYKKIMRLYNWNYVVDNLGTTPCDWRVRFFGTNDNSVLFSSSGTLNVPSTSSSSGYMINYNEILRWIATTPNPFPQQLRAGRIRYYSSIPTQITGSWPNYGSTDQRFWKEFIDYVLGFRQTSASTYYDINNGPSNAYTNGMLNSMAGYGADFTWGTTSISSPPSSSPPQYMSYTDNPLRPLLRYWFGPLNMVDYLHNMNMSEQATMGNPCVQGYYIMEPGDGYEAPLYSGKQAFLGAIQTMQTNNPNDWFTVICYSWPRGSSNGTVTSGYGLGRFNCVRSPLGPNYNYAQAALLFPFSTINTDGSYNNTEITPYNPDPATGSIPSADLMDTPRGDGDTCFDMALMLAYNQFATTSPTDTTLRGFVSSSPITFPSGMAGGLGRKGAQKVVVFETDGIPNTSATANLVSMGSYNYYQIRYDMNNPSGSEYPSVSINGDTNIQTLVQRLQSDYTTTRNPFRLYAIGFGPVFQGSDASTATTTLQNMMTWAQTSGSPSIITGKASQMTATMIQAYTSILQNGVQIALIK